MKKRIKSLLAIAVWTFFCISANAQGVQVATLQHGENMKAYYGSGSFVKALEDAVDGDVISLSSGIFDVPNDEISKRITIQGAGYVQKETTGRNATYLTGLTFGEIPDSDIPIIIEGVSLTNISLASVSNVVVRKVSVLNYSNPDNPDDPLQNVMLEHCRIGTLYDGANLVSNSMIGKTWSAIRGTQFSNCFFAEGSFHESSLTNCVIAWYGQIVDCLLVNTVVADMDYWTKIDENNHLDNAYIITQEEIAAMFQQGIDWDELNDYRLTDAAAAKYTGTDGKQVGVYGGSRPFTDVPGNPQIVYHYVAPETNAEGKLPVKFIIEAQK